MAVLDAALEQAGSGRAPVVVVHGEAGIGKTTLVERFAHRARETGATVLSGTCHEGGGPPYGPWLEAIDRHLAMLEPGSLAQLLGHDAPVLSAIAPSISLALDDLAPAPELPSAEGALRLLDAIARLLARLEKAVVVLDDVQWADPAALELIVSVARLVPGLLLVVVFRGGRFDLENPLAVPLGRIARVRECTFLLLGGLSRGEAAQVLERVADMQLDPGLIDAIYSETRGNPFFLGEVARHLHRTGVMNGGTQPAWRLPPTVRAAVALRLEALSPQTRAMLELAAMFTSGFAFDELQGLTGFGTFALLDSLEEALAEALLEPVDGERYDFTHALVRHALYDRVNPSRRARMHRQLAEALERLYGDPPPPLAAEIARQYGNSGSLPGAERGVTHALAAAAHARRVHAVGDAVELLELALELVAGGDHTTRGRVLGALALAQGEASMPKQAAVTLEEAVDVLERCGTDSRTIAELVCRVVSGLWTVVVYQAFLAPLISRTLALLGDERDLLWARVKALDRFVEPIRSGRVLIVRFVPFDPESQRIIRAKGTEADIATTLSNSGPTDSVEIEPVVSELDHWRDPAARCAALIRLLVRFSIVDPQPPGPAERLCDDLEATAEQIGAIGHRAAAHVFRAAVYGARGALGAAAEEMARGRAFAARLPEPVYEENILIWETLVAQHRDPTWWRCADQLWQLARAPYPSPDPVLCAGVACQAYALGGVRAKVRAVFGEILPGLEQADPWDAFVSPTVAAVAAAIWEMRDAEAAASLIPIAQRIVAAGVPDFYMSSNDLTIARLATVLDRFGEAAPAFARARERLTDRQAPMRAIVDYDEALARRWRLRRGAYDLLLAAESQFDALEMTVWSGRVQRLTGTRELVPDGLTRREAQVLRLLASGMTNREIAANLVLSVHTVERHLGNAYRKIGAHNRADAAAYTVRMGL